MPAGATFDNYCSTAKTDQDVEKKEIEFSMMPPGLANALSIEELASLVACLEDLKK
jgi:hypothetical protein